MSRAKRRANQSPVGALLRDALDRLAACERVIGEQQRIREAAGQYIVAKRAYHLAKTRLDGAAELMDATILAVLHGDPKVRLFMANDTDTSTGTVTGSP